MTVLLRTYGLGVLTWMCWGCASLPETAVQRIRQAESAYQARRYEEVDKLVSPVISEHKDKPEVAEAYYLRALAAIQTQNRHQAKKDLLAARSLANNDEVRAQVEAQLGHMTFADADYEAAVAHYRRAVERFPHRTQGDEVLYQLGLSLLRCGQFDAGRRALRTLPVKFPSSRYVDAARRKAAWPHDYFAVQCGAFSNAEKAADEAQRWRGKNLPVNTMRGNGNDADLYLVQVGRSPTFEAIKPTLDRVRQTAPDAFIVP